MTARQAALAEVGRTAFGVATARATESARSDRLFSDPHADLLLDASGPETRVFWTEGEGAQLFAAMGDYIALRTRYFDDRLGVAVAAGCPQLVLVAAGLDTRAFRLGWPSGMHIYELDQPAVLDFKRSVLDDAGVRPTCVRAAIGIDLREDWRTPLLDAGFRPGLPTCWLVEGLLVYLTADEADRLLVAISALSGPGSRLNVEYVNRPTLEAVRVGAGSDHSAAIALLASLWRNDMRADPVDWLAGHGWRAESHELTGLAAEHGRPVPPVFDPARPGTARISLLSAENLSPGGTT